MVRARSWSSSIGAALVAFVTLPSIGLSGELPAGDLWLREHPGSLVGEFHHDSSSVAFSAVTGEEGELELAVDVNGMAVDAAYFPDRATVVLDGHDGMVFPDDRQVLQALALRLEAEWRPYSAELPVERHFAFRLILLLSEAPAGYVLERRSYERPPMSFDSTPREHRGTPRGGGAGGPIQDACVDVADDDGITYYAGSCDIFVDVAYHDACPAHGFEGIPEEMGCALFVDCMARCGAGCGFFNGTGAYTWDCGDHDSCCGIHGGCIDPWDEWCGDEYDDAADDFLWGAANCYDCAAYVPPPPEPPCGQPFQDTGTWLVTPDGTTARAAVQLGVPLTRRRERAEGHFLLDEWAVVSRDAGVARVDAASSPDFSAMVRRRVDTLGAAGAASFLVVQSGNHPLDSRHIPLPTSPEVTLELPAASPTGDLEPFWFRAEVAAGGALDAVSILDRPDHPAPGAFRRALQAGLDLRYVDERRHRVAVFGLARFTADGRVSLGELLVTLPQCCCGEEICV